MVDDPTRLQQQASDPEASVWVSASAGSGKTKVLTDRVLRLLLTGISPSRILCITYTKAAAAEMRERVHRRLSAWVTMDDAALDISLEALTGNGPSDAHRKLARRLFALLLDATPGLRILTIHAFCQSLLARFPLEAEVPPHFTVIEETEAEALLKEARMRLIRMQMEEGSEYLNQSLGRIGQMLGEDGFDKLTRTMVSARRELERVLDHPGGAPHVRVLISATLGLPFDGYDDAQWRQEFTPDAERLERFRSAIPILAEGMKTDQALATALGVYFESGELEDLLWALLSPSSQKKRQNLPTKKIAEAHPWLQVLVQEEMERMVQALERRKAMAVAEDSAAVLDVAEALFAIYRSMKLQRGLMDYDDLILKARELLCSEKAVPWVLFKLDGGIDHLLLDEAQDTSPEQWELTRALVDEFYDGVGRYDYPRTLFVVGDDKQSIYRFQGAAPEKFAEMRALLKERAGTAGVRFEDIRMQTSFRSSPAVLEAVDAVFSRGVAASVYGDGAVQHIAYWQNNPGQVTLWPLLGKGEAQVREPWTIPNVQEDGEDSYLQLAEHLAEVIAGWLAEKRILPSTGQPVQAGDILVLVRRRNALVTHLSRALRARDVPVAGLDRLRLTEHIATQDLMALGQCLLLPEDDLNLVALLKSPLYGVQEETLFALCHGRGEASVWQRLQGYDGDDDACYRACEELSALFARADYGTPYDLYTDLLFARDGTSRFIARLGHEVEEVLHEFLLQIAAYERAHAPSLQGFLHWLQGGSKEVKRDMEQTEDEVRIMTVHGAKGLEAPIVFLPDTTGVPQMRKALFTVPVGADECLFYSPRKEDDSLVPAALREAFVAAEIEEYYRLLYVAMTRAREELYICGVAPGKKAGHVPWYEAVQEGMEALEGCEKVPMSGLFDGQDALVFTYAGEPGEAGERKHTIADVPTMPPHLSRPLPAEPAPKAPIAPSHVPDLAADESPERVFAAQVSDKHVMRGTLIHRLFQLLDRVAAEDKRQVAAAYVAHHVPDWGEAERAGIVEEVFRVMEHPDYGHLFAPGSLSEVPVSGVIDGDQPVNGQIDRLVMEADKLLIIDFKTGAVPEAGCVPERPLRQMQAYASLLRLAYPEKRVEGALLYTAGPAYIPLSL